MCLLPLILLLIHVCSDLIELILLLIHVCSDMIAKGEERARDFQWAVIPVGKTLGDVRAGCKPTRKTGMDFPLEFAATHHADLQRFLKSPAPRRKGLHVLLLDELNLKGNKWTGYNPAFKYLQQELATYLWYDHYEDLGLPVCFWNIVT
jgi:hypothetical protein